MRLARVVLALLATPALVAAQTDVTPGLGAVLTGNQAPGVWYVDRYAPATFQSIPSYQGRNGVLDVGISAADANGSRGPSYDDIYYNTQGRKTDVSTSGGFRVQADLFVESGWANAANGFVRSDIWGTMLDATSNVSAYPIIGFTNYGGAPRFRAWADANGWIDLASPVNFGAWNTLGFDFDGVNFSYFVNGYTPAAVVSGNGGTQLSNVMVQAYNFGQDFGPNAGPSYDVHWSNTPTTATPEPASLSLTAGGLLALGAAVRRRRNA